MGGRVPVIDDDLEELRGTKAQAPPAETGDKETEAMADADAENQEAETADVEENSEQNADAQGEQATEQQQASANQGTDFDNRIKGLESALTEERKQRQEAIRQLDYLRGAVERGGHSQQQTATKPQPIVTEDEFWNDIEGSLAKVYQRGRDEGAQMAMSHLTTTRINQQAMELAREHEDYPEAERSYLQMARMNPAMLFALEQSSNPAAAIYAWHQQQKTAASEDVAQLKARIAELEKAAGKPPPKTQAGAREAGGKSAGGVPDLYADSPLDQ